MNYHFIKWHVRKGNREDLETMKFIGDFDLHLLQHLSFFLCKPAKKKFVHWIQLWGRSHLRSDGVDLLIAKFASSGLNRLHPTILYTNLRIPNPKHPKSASDSEMMKTTERFFNSKIFTSTSRQLEDAPSQFCCFWPRCTRLSTLVLLLVLDAHLANAYSFPPTGIFAEKNSTLNP
jgi:hypothetical protein